MRLSLSGGLVLFLCKELKGLETSHLMEWLNDFIVNMIPKIKCKRDDASKTFEAKRHKPSSMSVNISIVFVLFSAGMGGSIISS